MQKKPVFEVINPDEIYRLGDLIDNNKYRILFYTIYLTGARVSEALKLRKRDIKMTETGEITFNLFTLKNRNHPRRIIPVLYNDSKHTFFHDYEKKMIDHILEHIKWFAEDEKLFDMTRQMSFNHFYKISTNVSATVETDIIDNIKKKINPHYLRHCRLTHMVSEYGYDSIDLMLYAGWSNVNPCRTYLHLGHRNLSAKMRRL